MNVVYCMLNKALLLIIQANSMTEKYVIGLDYGTDSARAVVVNTLTGAELALSVKYYPRWAQGKYCNPDTNQYRQHPQDYIDVLEASVKEALAKCPKEQLLKCLRFFRYQRK